MTRLEPLVQALPPNLQREVEDFAQFLVDRGRSPTTPFPFHRKLHLQVESKGKFQCRSIHHLVLSVNTP